MSAHAPASPPGLFHQTFLWLRASRLGRAARLLLVLLPLWLASHWLPDTGRPLRFACGLASAAFCLTAGALWLNRQLPSWTPKKGWEKPLRAAHDDAGVMGLALAAVHCALQPRSAAGSAALALLIILVLSGFALDARQGWRDLRKKGEEPKAREKTKATVVLLDRYFEVAPGLHKWLTAAFVYSLAAHALFASIY